MKMFFSSSVVSLVVLAPCVLGTERNRPHKDFLSMLSNVDAEEESHFSDASIETNRLTTNTCYEAVFTTGSDANATSDGDFYVFGYGYVPEECKNETGASCTISPICPIGGDYLDIIALTDDDWQFSLSGASVGSRSTFSRVAEDCLYREENETADATESPTWMDNDAYDFHQRYNLTSPTEAAPNKMTCAAIEITTVVDSDGPFYLEGYGEVPDDCLDGGSCSLEVCSYSPLDSRHTFEAAMFATTADDWGFLLNDTVVAQTRYESVPDECGSVFGHQGDGSRLISVMDTDEYDYFQLFTFATSDTKTDKDRGEACIDGWECRYGVCLGGICSYIKAIHKLLADDGADFDGYGDSVDVDGDLVIVGATGHNVDGKRFSGSAYLLQRDNVDVWSQQYKLVANESTASDRFGSSVALWGDGALVGVPGDDDAAGTVHVFVHNDTNTTWPLKNILKIGGTSQFGGSLDVDGNTAIIGAPFTNSSKGTAYVFTHDETHGWSQYQELITSDDREMEDYFGWSTGIHGNRAIVGAFGVDDDTGAAYVFSRNEANGQWSEESKLVASDGQTNVGFGRDTAIQGDVAIVGAPYASRGGTIYAFVYGEEGWVERDKVTGEDVGAASNFGWSIDMDGDHAVVGAPEADCFNQRCTGRAFLFRIENDGTLTLFNEPVAEGIATGAQFGLSVALSGDTAVVGAPLDRDNNNVQTGAVYTFETGVTSTTEGPSVLPSSQPSSSPSDPCTTCPAKMGSIQEMAEQLLASLEIEVAFCAAECSDDEMEWGTELYNNVPALKEIDDWLKKFTKEYKQPKRRILAERRRSKMDQSKLGRAQQGYH